MPKPNIPRSLVMERVIRCSERLKRNTEAPICGTPLEFRTTPAMLPESATPVAGNAASADKKSAAITRAASLGRTVCIRADYCGRAVCAHPPQTYFTVKLAVGVTV